MSDIPESADTPSAPAGDCLTGHLLIAMPGMSDPNFEHTVTLMLEHHDEGAFGLVINRPIGMEFGDVLEQLSLETEDPALANQPVLRGGPVQPERGFVLYANEPQTSNDWDSTAAVNDEIRVTTSPDILNDMAQGKGPGKALFVLGYAGWAPGQLESELADNAWLSVAVSPEILFQTPMDKRWEAATKLLGIDPALLSSEAGHA